MLHHYILHMNILNKTKSAIFVSLMCYLPPESSFRTIFMPSIKIMFIYKLNVYINIYIFFLKIVILSLLSCPDNFYDLLGAYFHRII